jgi:hypothetical protein
MASDGLVLPAGHLRAAIDATRSGQHLTRRWEAALLLPGLPEASS